MSPKVRLGTKEVRKSTSHIMDSWQQDFGSIWYNCWRTISVPIDDSNCCDIHNSVIFISWRWQPYSCLRIKVRDSGRHSLLTSIKESNVWPLWFRVDRTWWVTWEEKDVVNWQFKYYYEWGWRPRRLARGQGLLLMLTVWVPGGG